MSNIATATATLALPTNNVLAPMTQVSVIKGAYIQHPHASARNFAAIQAKFGRKPCNETTPVLIDADRITPLEPLDFFMTPYYKQYYAEQDTQGIYTRCYPIDGGAPKGVKECIDSLIIVAIKSPVEGGATEFVPARMRLKSGKCKLLTTAYDALTAMEANDKRYAPLAKAGLQPYLFCHFVPSYTQEIAKVSKKPYYTAIATGEVTTPDIAKALAAAMKNPEFVAAFNVAVEGYNETTASVEAMGG